MICIFKPQKDPFSGVLLATYKTEEKLPSSDLEHCCAANFTDGLCCFLSILHRYILMTFAFSFCATLNTVHCHNNLVSPVGRTFDFHLLSGAGATYLNQRKYTTTSRLNMPAARRTVFIRSGIIECLLLTRSDVSILFDGFSCF